MAFDVQLKDNGVGTFDISLSFAQSEVEKSIPFMGLLSVDMSNSGETSYVFID